MIRLPYRIFNRAAQTVLKRAEQDDLSVQPGPTNQEFSRYLESGLVERDFREMFTS